MRSTLTILLLTACAVSAAEPRPVRIEIAVPADSEHYPAAARTAATLAAVNDRVKIKYPGLARYARERGYRVVVDTLPTADDGSQIQGRHTGGRRLIEIHHDLWASPARLAEVYAHEIGHAIYEGLSHIERQAVVAEYAAARRGGMPDVDINEVFAELTARIATGRLSTRLPETQRIIRRRICK
ncbi:MAG: hypothetical protein RRC34_02930 [Lentisphaeria bacterium]|nr:hypothetical protein [Lentisphaeria bacterium]